MPRSLDAYYYKRGFRCIAGVDEVGRGSLAGPLVAAAVIMPRSPHLRGIRDSKCMVERRREELFPHIAKNALACSVASMTSKEVDAFGLHRANLFLLSYCLTHLPVTPNLALVDGFAIEHFIPTVAVIDGDKKSYSIAAASIVAKVIRDRLMRGLDSIDSRYGFARHKGYGTALHKKNLTRFGVSPWHRTSFAPIHQLLYNT